MSIEKEGFSEWGWWEVPIASDDSDVCVEYEVVDYDPASAVITLAALRPSADE
jgi:hypothetical protein